MNTAEFIKAWDDNQVVTSIEMALDKEQDHKIHKVLMEGLRLCEKQKPIPDDFDYSELIKMLMGDNDELDLDSSGQNQATSLLRHYVIHGYEQAIAKVSKRQQIKIHRELGVVPATNEA